MQIPLLASQVGIALGMAVFVALITALAYGASVLLKYVRLSVEVMDNQAWVPENGNGDSNGWRGQEVQFKATDGHTLVGLLMRGSRAGQAGWKERGAVIFAHEFGSDRSIAARYCRSLVDEGFDVLAFDFRGHGLSESQAGYYPRQWPSDRETSDMCGAIRFLSHVLERQGRSPRIALFGLSRGAGTAILATENEPNVYAIIADGAYSSDGATEYFMRRFAAIFAKARSAEKHPPVFWKLMRWLLFREYTRRTGCQFPSVRKVLARLRRMPILFIHGEKDSYIPVSHCQALYEVARGPKALWIVAEARHNQCMKIDPEAYVRRIVQFLDEHVSLNAQPARTAPSRPRRHEVPVATPSPALVPNLVSAQVGTATAV